MVTSYNLKQFKENLSIIALEVDIEKAMNKLLRDCFGDSIDIYEQPAIENSSPDAFMMLYNADDDGKYVGHGIVEAKRFIEHDTRDYKKQLIQVLGYHYLYTKVQHHKNDFLIVYSANYFDFILIKENKEVIESYNDMIKNGLRRVTPCNLYKEAWLDTSDLKIHRFEFNDNPDLIKIIKDLINKLDNN